MVRFRLKNLSCLVSLSDFMFPGQYNSKFKVELKRNKRSTALITKNPTITIELFWVFLINMLIRNVHVCGELQGCIVKTNCDR